MAGWANLGTAPSTRRLIVGNGRRAVQDRTVRMEGMRNNQHIATMGTLQGKLREVGDVR